MKARNLVSSFISGVLDPRMAGRMDVEQYYNGMSQGENVVTVPLGGVKRRPGLKYIDQLPYVLERITSGITISAPNGGTTANANDDDESTVVLTTTNIGTTDQYVVVSYDLGAATDIRFVDAVNLKLTAGTSDFDIEHSLNGSAWTILDYTASGNFLPVDTTDQTFRAGIGVVSARYVRVTRRGTADLGTAKASIAEFNIWIETSTVSEVRLLPFERSTDEGYVIVATDRCLSLYLDGVYQQANRAPYVSADLAELDAAQSQDTMILTHEDHAPRSLVREAANNWQLYEIEFTGVPKYDYNDASSPTPTSEVQDLVFTSFVEGNTFQIDLEGARTGPISYSSATATTAENMRREIQKLYTVGFGGVSVAHTGGTTYRVTFAEDSADALDLMVGIPLSAASGASIAASQITNGSPRREAVWSATRGYPRTVTFHEGRLWFGGTRSLRQAYFGSVVNDFFNFETGEGLDDDAVFGAMNTAQLNAVTGLRSGRFLVLLTSGGEFRFTVSPITPADAPRVQTEYGAKQIKPVAIDGAMVFVQRTGKALRDFLYRYEEDAYSSFALSVLAAHLLNDIVDISAWQGNSTEDANYVFLVNSDGTIAVYNTLRSQEISAFTKWTTDGEFKAVGVVNTDRYFAVAREINGVDGLYLELADDAFYLDCAAQTTTFGGGGTLVGTLGEFEHLIGEELRVRADGFVLENNTPDGSGNMTLEYAPTTLVEAGLGFTVTVQTMPLNADFGDGGNFLRKKRIVKARVLVYESLGILYNGRELPDRYFDLDSFDTPPDPFTGTHSLEESSNWDEGLLRQTFTQVDPLPFHLQAIEFTVESS